jgi:beta-lactamase class A
MSGRLVSGAAVEDPGLGSETGMNLQGVLFGAMLLTLSGAAHAFDAAALDAAAHAEEAALPARLGAAVLDTGTEQLWTYSGDERFPLDSTHKAFACAALLARADRGETSLDRRVVIPAAAIVEHSPITQAHIAPNAMSLSDFCAAAIGVSDNTAANFVLAALGGPEGLTQFFRALGDATSRLDRTETDLNESAPGDPRDTTTPAAAVADLRKILIGDALKPASRERLTQWMEDDRVAGPLLRAALPGGWRIADKTGAGGHGSRGIVAAIWPPGRAAIVVAIYLTETPASLDARNSAIARIGAALVKALGP